MAVVRLGSRFWLAAPLAAGGAALVSGIPTDVVSNPWFQRMTPVRDLDVVFWVVTSVLLGALIATFAAGRLATGAGGGRAAGFGSGTLGILAVGCPICNKLVVALLGVSGALSSFAPLQPLLGGTAVALAGAALHVRLRGLLRACPLPGASVPSPRS